MATVKAGRGAGAPPEVVLGSTAIDVPLRQRRESAQRRTRLGAVTLLVTDLVAALVGLGLGALVSNAHETPQLLALAPIWPVAVTAAAAHRAGATSSARSSVRPAIGAAAGLLVVASLMSYLLGAAALQPAGLLTALTVAAVAAVLVRLAGLPLGSSGSLSATPPRILLVGSGDEVTHLAGRLNVRHGEVAGAVVPTESVAAALDFAHKAPVFGGLDRIAPAAELVGAERVVVAAGQLSGEALRRLAWVLEHQRVELVIALGLEDVDAHRFSLSVLGGIPLLGVAPPKLVGPAPLSKEVFDRSVTVALLALTAPLFGAIALLLKLFDPGPLLFRQQRLGRDGKPFGMYKFRTMRTQYSGRPPLEVFAELGREDLVTEFLRDQKVRHDPRVSRIGHFLRRTSLDELPQLLNVLKGQLSLVGPRPIVSEELDRFGHKAGRILSCKPGITGLWQVSGRNDLGYDERVRMNVYYIDNWHLSFDVRILLRTVSVLFTREGAR